MDIEAMLEAPFRKDEVVEKKGEKEVESQEIQSKDRKRSKSSERRSSKRSSRSRSRRRDSRDRKSRRRRSHSRRRSLSRDERKRSHSREQGNSRKRSVSRDERRSDSREKRNSRKRSVSKDEKRHSRERRNSRKRSLSRDERKRSDSRERRNSRKRSLSRDERKRGDSRERRNSRDRHSRDRKKSSRSRSRDRKSHRSRSRDRRQRRNYSPDRKRNYSPDRRRNYSPEERDRNQRDKSPPPPPLSREERDKRTIFVMQLAFQVRPQDIKAFFAPAGKVRDVRMVNDKYSGRPKGCAYVEFQEEVSVQNAVVMNGQKLLGFPVTIQKSESEKNRLAEEMYDEVKQSKNAEKRYRRIFVGNLPISVTLDQIKALVQPFGRVEHCELQYDEKGLFKGVAYVQYSFFSDARFRFNDEARRANEQLNGLELVDKRLKVGPIYDDSEMSQKFINARDLSHETSSVSKARTELMFKLSRDQELLTQVPIINPSFVTRDPSSCLLLKNMYDPDEEKELHWEYEIEDEVKEECSKYGKVIHIHVKKNKEGEIYLKVDNVLAGEKVYKALNGRWFAGRQVSCTFIPLSSYSHLFPKS